MGVYDSITVDQTGKKISRARGVKHLAAQGYLDMEHGENGLGLDTTKGI